MDIFFYILFIAIILLIFFNFFIKSKPEQIDVKQDVVIPKPESKRSKLGSPRRRKV